MSAFDLKTDTHRYSAKAAEMEFEHLAIVIISGLIPIALAMVSTLLYLYEKMP